MYNVVVVGSGIIGLASAMKILETNPTWRVAIIDKEKSIAQHQTGHNSGVIHSGLYYTPGSAKAKNCLDGYNQLIRFCEEEGIHFDLCGKIVVATSNEEVRYLHQLTTRGEINGLINMKKLSTEELREHEPHVAGVEGLFVPQTGIVDYKKVAQKYAEKFQYFGGELFMDNEAKDFKRNGKVVEVITNRQTLTAQLVINCAGLHSDKVTALTGVAPSYRIIPFRGEYYELVPKSQHLVKNLIYPVPDPNFPFLGVHFTRMINGGIEAGPNAVLAYSREGYTKTDVHLGELFGVLTHKGFRKIAKKYWRTGWGEFYRSYSKGAFIRTLQRLLPEIEAKDIKRKGAGVRAQACTKEGGLIDDFLIFEKDQFINIGNAPSPAATASLAIGAHVAQLTNDKLR